MNQSDRTDNSCCVNRLDFVSRGSSCYSVTKGNDTAQQPAILEPTTAAHLDRFKFGVAIIMKIK